MKKNFTFFKTLLVAAGLCVGSSAWAAVGDVTTNVNINFDNLTVDDATALASVTGTKGSLTLGTSNFFAVKVDEGSYRLGIRNAETSATIPTAEYAGTKDIVTISFDMAMSTQGDNSNNKTIKFYIKDADNADIASFVITTNKGDTGPIVSNTNTLGVVNDDVYVGSSIDWSKKVSFIITLNYATRKITTQTSCAGAKNTTNTHTVDMSNTNPVAKFTFGAAYNTGNVNYRTQFDNILIQTEEGDYATSKEITLAFKDNEDNDISSLYKGQTLFTPENGQTFTPSDYYPTVMYDGEYKYTYASGGDAFTVNEDKTVTLVYTKTARPQYNVNVTANYGDKNQVIVDNVSVYEAADYTYYYPRFIKDGSTLYKYTSSSDPNATSYWRSNLSNVKANATYTLTYNAMEGECVYYSEGEDLAGAVAYDGGFRQYMSGGSCAVLSSGTTLANFEAGTYTMTVRALGRSSGDRHAYLYLGSTEGEQIMHFVVDSNSGSERSVTVTVEDNTAIVAQGGYYTTSGNGAGIDYIYIMKTATPTATISAAGWATLYTDYALDFSNVEGLTAYTATCDGSTVTLTAVDNVPAGTGVVLKGAAATYSIPVIASSETAKGSLEGSTTSATAYDAVNGKDLYMLALNADNEAQFTKVTSGSIAAGKAYLPVAQSSNPAKLRVVFGDNATAINSVEIKKVENGVMYNLAGQRVGKDYKGIVIVNGKKIMNK